MASQLPSHRFFVAFRAWNRFTRQSCSSSWHHTRTQTSFPVFTTTGSRNYSIAASSDVDAQTVPARSNNGQNLDVSTDMRALMRNLRHTLVVITTCKDADWPFEQSPSRLADLSPFYTSFCGATVSSFNTVTLGPPPIVSFNLRVPSKTLSGILKHKQFRVNVVRATRLGATIAHAFVQGKHEEAFEHAAALHHWVGLDNVQALAERTSLGDSAPFIHGVGIRAIISCKAIPEKFVDVGDHVIVVAEVLRVRSVGRVDTSVLRIKPKKLAYGLGLTYYGQQYRDAMSKPINPVPIGGLDSDRAGDSSQHSDITGVNVWMDQPLRVVQGKIVPFDQMPFHVNFDTR